MRHRFALIITANTLLFGQPAQLPEVCEQFAPDCLYRRSTEVRFAESSTSVTYKDIAGLDRAVVLQVRVPDVTGDALLPVVVWSPGADLESSVAETPLLRNWSDTTAAAGYLTVTVGHVTRDEAQKAALCRAIEIPDELCGTYDAGAWDRAQDLQFILQNVAAFNESGPPGIRGRIDLEKVAVAGFAAGADAAMSSAGAGRLLTPGATRVAPNLFRAEGPAAFVFLSPPAPGADGFFEYDYLQPQHSWSKLDRPALTLTGAGDNTCQGFAGCMTGATPALRTIAFQLQPANGKYQFFLKPVTADHSFLGSLDVDDCVGKEVEQIACESNARYLKSAVLAFLDSSLGKVSRAQLWMNEGLIVPASADQVAWRKK